VTKSRQQNPWERFSIATEKGGIALQNRSHNEQRRRHLMGFVRHPCSVEILL
jgi:hypothetical protein